LIAIADSSESMSGRLMLQTDQLILKMQFTLAIPAPIIDA
jgi:hypothetical protein